MAERGKPSGVAIVSYQTQLMPFGQFTRGLAPFRFQQILKKIPIAVARHDGRRIELQSPARYGACGERKATIWLKLEERDAVMNERALFDAALEFEDPVKQLAFVKKACKGDQEQLQKVLSLLEAHNKASTFLDSPAIRLVGESSEEALPNSDVYKTSDFSLGTSELEAYDKATTKITSGDDADEEEADLSFLSPSTKPGSIGSLGHYEILQILGQGGFGIVFKAFDEKLHRLVAIKVMNPQMAATSPPRKRFLREARSVAAIKHENIVQVYSVEEIPLPYMVMEFIDGETLQHRLDGDGPLEIDEILSLGCQIARALAGAHALGIIHRDIKPGNILLERGVEPKIKVTDFGLARAADDASMTRSGMISGTPMYMAPEQALGQQLDHRTDLFSLGSVLYQMACGRAPFRAPSAIAILRRVAEDTPRPLQEILPSIPAWLVAVVEKLLAKNPEDRFQSAKEVADLLTQYKGEIQLHGKVTSHVTPSQSASVATRQPADQSVRQRSSFGDPNKKKLFYAVGAIACVLLIVSVIPFFLPGKQNKTEIESQGAANNQSVISQGALPETTDDRSVAEWARALSTSTVLVIEGRSGWLSTKDELPPGAIHLTSLQIPQVGTDFGNEDLIRIGQCRHLRVVEIIGTGLLQNITDEGIRTFSESAAAKGILQFEVYPTPKLTDASIKYFNRMESLKTVRLHGANMTDSGVKQLHLPGLKAMSIEFMPITLSCLQDINSRFPNLEVFALQAIPLGDDELKFLENLPLRILSLPVSGVTARGIRTVNQIVSLTELRLSGNESVNDACLSQLTNLSQLRVLHLEHTSITDAGLESIAKLHSLELLTLGNCKKLTEAGVKKIREALPKCKIESDFRG